MRLVTFANKGEEKLGALFDGDSRVADLAGAHRMRTGNLAPQLSSMLALIDGGPAALEIAREALAHARSSSDGVLPTRDVRLKAPLPRPVQMRDFLCFEEHLKNSFARAIDVAAAGAADPAKARAQLEASGRFAIPPVWYEIPVYYKCNRMSVIGPDEDVIWPGYSHALDYELELAAIIGKRGVNIPRERALEHIFGYTIFNDVSARDYQMREMAGSLGPAKGKDFDTGNILGPCIVTADEIDPYDLTMIARVNGEQLSRGSSSTMHHRFEDCIAHVSQSETLYPGEVLCSGTVGGGCGLEHGRLLAPGDTVELEIEKIGVLRNRMVKRAEYAGEKS
jgi:2-keto-4-pentenoate hydratase/2-oxohepta-3-ene-1,7-dioic acid hydratase in catechol pathway